MTRSDKGKQAAQNYSLGLSAFHERLRSLETEHEWLLKQIQRKRKELKKFLDEMRSIATEIFTQSTPLYQKMMEVDAEIHSLFEQILSTKKFGKKNKKNINEIYQSLQYGGIISPQFSDEDEDEELDDMFDNEFDEDSDDFFNENTGYYQGNNPSEFDTESAYKSSEARQIRQTFLKLASLFHPDKVTDEETQMRHNEIMKEVNRAYQEGDIARLLELEKQHHLEEDFDLNNSTKSEVEKQCQRREKDNELLKTQYENIKRELRLARNTPEGEIVKDYRSCKRSGIDPIKEVLSQLEEQIETIESIRDFVKSFRDKKITLKEFLKGPRFFSNNDSSDQEEILKMLLEDLL